VAGRLCRVEYSGTGARRETDSAETFHMKQCFDFMFILSVILSESANLADFDEFLDA
jgi:hypothetical protein